jgi:hypothetical protein
MSTPGPDSLEEEGIERFMKEVDGYAGLWASQSAGLLDKATGTHALAQSRDKLKKKLRGILKANRKNIPKENT